MNGQTPKNGFRKSAMHVLAVVGFIAVLIGGLWGSILVARATPGAFTSLAAAIVSVTSVFIPADDEGDTTTPEEAAETEVEESADTGETQVSGSTERTAGNETTTIEVISTGGTPSSDPNGFVDLSARVIEIGLVDKATGEFTASSSPSRSAFNQRAAVRFLVENLGTRTSGQWTFNAVLPTFPSHIYSSPSQLALAPGDRTEYTLGFDSFEEDGEGTLIVNVDPTNSINEPNKDNNILRVTVVLTD